MDEAGNMDMLKQHETNISPKELVAQISQHGELPVGVDKAKLQTLNSVMTQEEIVACHVAINTVHDPEKRSKLINEWIPKPHVLYHVSQNGEIAEFTPSPSPRTKDEPDSVFAATSRGVASMFGIKSEYTKSGSYDGGKTWTVVISDPAKFIEQDKGGYIYILPPENFGVNPNLGLGFAEWTSPTPVKPISVEHFDSAIKMMLDEGVQIIPASVEIMQQLRDPNIDDLSVLKNLKPVKSFDELKAIAS